ncbi:MAG TPA: hypothetical protein VGF44_03850 [Terriglobales bacterium]|jgi:hypothetical protein
MILRANERCPLPGHGFSCKCPRVGKKEKLLGSKWKQIATGLYRIDDPHHPRGYRERRSPAKLRELTMQKVKEQGGLCCVCDQPFEDITEISTEHKDSKGNGGCYHDDHPDNIGASHKTCNSEKGSRSLESVRHDREAKKPIES